MFPLNPLVAEVPCFLWYCSLHIRDFKEQDGNASKNARLVVIVSYIKHCIRKFHFVAMAMKCTKTFNVFT